MSELKILEVKIQPKFVIEEDVAYQCLTLLEMYCNSHNKVVRSFLRKAEGATDWSVDIDFEDATNFENENREVAKKVEEFVENRCRELGIDYTQIFTCNSAD